jgi:hypothetical protein
MKIAITLSAPPIRQVFRGVDVRAVAIVVERALWPLLEAGQPVQATVQCGNARVQALLNTYFTDMIRDEQAFIATENRSKSARA